MSSIATENVSQSEIMRKNIAAVAEMQHQAMEGRTPQERLADAITNFAGSIAFVYIHGVWFGAWILLNIGLIHIPHVSHFDPFPFGLLTLIVSLEAIFLSTFILIEQNRSSQVSERRSELDLQVNLLAEQKASKALEMLDRIMQQLDGMSSRFNVTADPEVEVLMVSPEPQEVLQAIEDAVKEETAEIKHKVSKAVDDITSETVAVRQEVGRVGEKVGRVDDKVEEVAADVEQIKDDIREQEASAVSHSAVRLPESRPQIP